MPTCVDRPIEELRLDGPAGVIEARLSFPKTTPRAAAIVCHPHPLHGGTMDNKVSYMLASGLNRLGLAALRFNFRGVGGSAGQFDHGVGESADVAALADWLKHYCGCDELWLAGFSFGSYVAWRTQQVARRLILVAPPVTRYEFAPQYDSGIPCLVLQGGQDDISLPSAVRAWTQSRQPQPDLRFFDDADHFFHGKLTEFRTTLETALGGELAAAEARDR
jgi:alpha/beta superfamily hydrolase